jgi:hypothetical protein
MLRDEAQPLRNAILDLEAREVRAGEGDTALQRQHAHDGVKQRGLARAIGTDDGDDLVVGNVKRYAADGLDLVIGDMGVGDGKQRAHAAAPR